MRCFAFFLGVAGWSESSPAETYSEIIDEALLAEEVGFDGVWVGEHHFTPEYSLISNPTLLCAAIAARTERIRIGPGCIVLPLHNPIRVAEDLAMLDALSGGRAEPALCRGDHPYEYEALGVDFGASRELYGAGLRTVKSLLDEAARGSSDGRRTSSGAEILTIPPPVQRPMPLWTTCGSAASVGLALDNGLRVAVAGGSGRSRIAGTRRTFEDECRKRGLDPAEQPYGLLVHGWLSDSEEEIARAADAAASVSRMAAQLREGHSSRPVAGGQTPPDPSEFRAANLVGDERWVREQVDFYSANGVTDLLIQLPRSFPPDRIRSNIRALAAALGLEVRLTAGVGE